MNTKTLAYIVQGGAAAAAFAYLLAGEREVGVMWMLVSAVWRIGTLLEDV